MSLIKPRTASVPIYQGDDLEHLADLDRAVKIAERRQAFEGDTAREGDGEDLQGAKDAYDAFVDVAAERAVLVEVQTIGRKKFRDLMAEHPPRRVTEADDEGVEREVTHEDDAPYSVNVEEFPYALLGFVDGDVRTMRAPEFGSQADRMAFLEDDLPDGEFERIWVATYWLNRSTGSDPSQLRYSVERRNTDETSSSHDLSA